ncbi:MAG: aminotransferase class I/II-fold pyridoxal phosphate-dependent enzyme [archaeon]|nr:aminotransferase class I/II-fold pyridoxal phosphate-dependent enzyme [archaeon]
MVKINPLLNRVERPSSIFPSRKEKTRLNWNELSPGYSPETFKRIMDSLTPEVLSSYPEYDVIYPLMAKYLGVNLDNIILESGSECGIKNVFEAFVPRGSSLVKPCPEFVMVDVDAQLFGAEVRNIHYNKNLEFSVSKLIDSIDKTTSLVYLANPNAPTSYYVERSDLLDILKKARESDAVVLVDECYIDFSGKQSAIDLINSQDNLIVSRSFSKSFGLAGARLGVLASNPYLNSYLHKTRPMREINAFAAEIGKFMLNHIEIPMTMISEIKETREEVREKLQNYGYEVPISNTNFILVNFGEDRQRFVQKCADLGILIKDNLGHESVSQYTFMTIGRKQLMRDTLNKIFPLK